MNSELVVYYFSEVYGVGWYGGDVCHDSLIMHLSLIHSSDGDLLGSFEKSLSRVHQSKQISNKLTH